VITESLTTNTPALSIVEAVTAKMNQLSLEQQQEILNFVEFLAQKTAPPKSIWEKIEEIVEKVPKELWEELPTDGAEQHDHYLQGTPKR
jgi:predicted glycosyltransferase